MGVSILELVLQLLREKGFSAEAAYPGQKFPAITGPVAAVHIEQVDRAALGVTLEVTVLCPAAMGGTQCELEALRATEVLRNAGAVCVQRGCTYDGVAQVYAVSVLASFTAVTGADSYRLGPGFAVYLNDLHHPYVISISARQITGAKAEYATASGTPTGVSRAPGLWELTVDELIPAGSEEEQKLSEDFEVKIIVGQKAELYRRCNWTEVRRTYTRDGLRRIRSGFALDHLEVK